MANGAYIGLSTCENPEYTYVIVCFNSGASWRNVTQITPATALLAAGHTETPLRALVYLAASQQPDGAFAQNFFIHGEPYWQGIQLDQVAFPVLIAWHLRRQDALQNLALERDTIAGLNRLLERVEASLVTDRP